MSRTFTICTYPIVAALKAADRFLDRMEWTSINPTQQQFLEQFWELCHGEIEQIKEIEAIADREYTVIKHFLSERSFNIQLAPWGPNQFGTAAVLDLLVQWREFGTRTTITTDDNQRFDAVRIRTEDVSFYTTPGHPHPIVELATKSGDKVYLTMCERIPNTSEFEAVELVERWTQHMQPDFSWNGVRFPMVDLNQEVNIEWLIGMTSDPNAPDPDTFEIYQALQQTKLKMNERGARVESAVALAMAPTGTGPRYVLPDHIINKPFLIWFTRDSLVKPLFVGYIDRDVWKDPGGLEKGVRIPEQPPSDRPLSPMELQKMVYEEMRGRLKHKKAN